MVIKDYIKIVDPKTDKHIFYDVTTSKEISISLFGECNLNCQFCIGNQRHNIRCPQNFDNVLDLVKTEITKTPKNDISIVLYGGELFHDGISDDTFKQYSQLIKQIRLFAGKQNKHISFTLSTNLIHRKRQRVLDLLADVGIDQLCSSFDFEQRFTNPKLLQTFLQNVEFYTKNNIKLAFGFILMKDNIDAFYNNHRYLQIFDYLYSKYPIYFDYYHPTNKDAAIVDEEDIGRFLIWLDTHYPNIKTLCDLRNHQQKTCCPATFIIDGIATHCCNFSQTAKQYAIKKQCMSCQYKNICSHPCIRLMSKNEHCFVQMYYDHLQKVD